jgi:glutathione S-transferase
MITLYCSGNTPPFLRPEWVRDLRVLWAAEECGVPYRVSWVDAGKGEQRGDAYKAVNPFGTIPSMTDGDFKLFESAAIVGHICDTVGTNIPAPRTKERALYDQWCFAALSTVEPPIFQLMIASTMAKDAAWAKERAPQLKDNSLARLAALDRHLAGRSYLLDAFSSADVLMGQVLNFVVDPAMFESARHVLAYHTRLKARPAYQRALTAQAGGKNASLSGQ